MNLIKYFIFSIKSDFLLGGISSNQNMDNYFSSSLIYYDDDLTWCVKRVEPLSFLYKLWYVATKLAWILCFLVITLKSVAVFFLLKLVKDKYGYLKLDLNISTQHTTCSSAMEMLKNRDISRNHGIIWKLFITLISIVILVISVAWSFLILKAIFQPIPEYQIQTIDELITHNVRLTGIGAFSNDSVWESSRVN